MTKRIRGRIITGSIVILTALGVGYFVGKIEWVLQASIYAVAIWSITLILEWAIRKTRE
ncbi:hypothetical protein CCYS_12880 [Corynebacterium cystitidis DSM 20524]|uniref:Uncharacterized protein n=1 Tax=Corynebacterium cystitidis DSM 20524 TaxID=1121357 RepID=A0A1H9T689_9CORY|nr:hypothetical protein CCYS_12880 [Corynebacterium cystitidis DSM 20524]SER92269.1 hypothetical protein SAMN05661109_01318 [Corynebacterium cystitidis DSM 20524]SNV61212.1 Uncharacterised protein [Corynebacterium cystitidis]